MTSQQLNVFDRTIKGRDPPSSVCDEHPTTALAGGSGFDGTSGGTCLQWCRTRCHGTGWQIQSIRGDWRRPLLRLCLRLQLRKSASDSSCPYGIIRAALPHLPSRYFLRFQAAGYFEPRHRSSTRT
jgi:hypothetical protein